MGSTVRFPKSAAQTTVCSRGGRQIGCAGLRPRTARRWGVTPGACSHLGATPEVALQSGIRNDQKGDQEPRSAAQQELWAAARGGGFHENDRRPTFLVLAISRLIERMRRRGASPRETLDAVLTNIVGFDIDPLAALASRTNYILALGSLVRAARGRNLDIPVYRADSMVGPTLQALQAGDRLMLETEAGTFSLPP